MRFSITILFLTLIFLIKDNVAKHERFEAVSVTKLAGQKIGAILKVSDLITERSTDYNVIKKGFESVPGHILQTLSRFSLTSTEARHFLDAFYVSFFTYFTFYNNYVKDSYFNLIAINKKLKIIYPHHSFW